MAGRKVKVRMLVNSWDHQRGAEVEVPRDAAESLVANGYAAWVNPPKDSPKEG